MPAWSERKRTPTSTGSSSTVVPEGVTWPNSEHGQLRPPTVTVTVAGALRLPLSSVARARTVTWPGVVGVQV